MISRQAMLPRCFNPLCLLLSQPSARLPSPALHHYRIPAKRPQRKKAAGSSPAACISIFTESVQSIPQRSASNILFPVLQEIPDPFAADRISELSQCFRLDLADTLSRYVELFSNFFQSSRMSVFKTESKNDDLTFSLFEITK